MYDPVTFTIKQIRTSADAEVLICYAECRIKNLLR